ncbi:MAG: esterase, partial [Hoylesella buccalis]
HYLIPVIRWIDDQQEGRERPIVYIDYATLHDSYGKATSSMHKAYKMLIERYQVYVVAAAPTNNHAYMGEVQAWVEEYLSAPAYNRVIFTNQSQLLYGDYLITPEAQKGFMGTCLAYGSDEFKTWEELIVYFDRLGGQ